MNLPWVARERFEKQLKRARRAKRALTAATLRMTKLEAELEHAQRVMKADADLIESQEAQIEQLKKELHSQPAPGPSTQPIGARPLLRDVIADVNRMAEENAKKGGDSIAQQLAEARFKGRRDAKRVNG